MDFTQITKKYVEVSLSATLANGRPADVSGVDVALLATRDRPDGETTWTAAERLPGYQLVRSDGETEDVDPALETFGDALAAWEDLQLHPDAALYDGLRIVTRWRVLVAAPDADPTDALVLPEGGADLWGRVTDQPETDTTRLVTIRIS